MAGAPGARAPGGGGSGHHAPGGGGGSGQGAPDIVLRAVEGAPGEGALGGGAPSGGASGQGAPGGGEPSSVEERRRGGHPGVRVVGIMEMARKRGIKV
ncbi:hypothetical protein GUJ93_ZPchr0010g7962 [Zizania palustris]|uniref:Uncharacterized protein n=1 Tax=Zizania palustris TaxID=103762 RepID=A0A8J5SZ15_ZIZPA|nr:hypothetical protein GUJ93_ZPchr0010g7962 [Zizania palustris]